MSKLIIKTMIVTLLLITMIGCSTNDWKKGIVEEQFIYNTAPFPSCHASTIAETPEGLVSAWFGGTYERDPDVCIYVSRKAGAEWTEPLMVADGVLPDTIRMPTWNPVLYQVPNGELLLFFKIGERPHNWKGYFIQSFDHGKTWTEKESLPEGFIGPVKNKPVLLDDGRLLCPSSDEADGWKVHFESTSDFGKTWEKIGPINDARVYDAIQPSILKHQDGRLQILCRSRNAVLVTSWSSDSGETWSLLQPSQLPNNNSGTDAVTLADGRHLLVYNHVKTPINAKRGYRTPLNVAISNDGVTWYAALVLDDSEIGRYSYPAVIQSSDGMVHITYTWRREKIKYVKIDPSMLKINRRNKIKNEMWPL